MPCYNSLVTKPIQNSRDSTYRKLITSFMLVCIVSACGSGGGGNTEMSDDDDTSNLMTSHNAGQDCMECHNDNATDGADAFTVAGTIYSSSGVQRNATIRLYVPNTNTLRVTLMTDDSGNFYTTEAVEGLFTGGELVDGLEVEVQGPSSTRNMPGIITNGSCNGCHHTGNGGNGRIVVN